MHFLVDVLDKQFKSGSSIFSTQYDFLCEQSFVKKIK